MADYPISAFNFEVTVEGTSIKGSFTEVSGLKVETQVIEYRVGNSPDFSTTKMPGLRTNGPITLKRGIFKGNNDFYDWWNDVSLSTVDRRTITISLNDEEQKPVMTWQLSNAWPTKVEGPALNSTGNSVAVETMEIVHEGITSIKND